MTRHEELRRIIKIHERIIKDINLNKAWHEVQIQTARNQLSLPDYEIDLGTPCSK